MRDGPTRSETVDGALNDKERLLGFAEFATGGASARPSGAFRGQEAGLAGHAASNLAW